MRQLIAFTNKEFVEVWRTSKFIVLTIVFVLFGIMNPAIAKLTPWIMEKYSDSLKEQGMVVGEVAVDAMSSWMQYYKNIPMGLIVFMLVFSGILANEFQKGTLINVITKGLKRSNIIIAKTLVMLCLWTLNYWMCFGITYVYNEYFWDNSVAKHLFFSAFCMYMFGAWLISVLIFVSTLVTSSAMVCVGTSAIFFTFYLISIVPDFKRFMPTKLLESSGLLTGNLEPKDFVCSLIGISIMSIVLFISGIIIFNKKKV